MLEPDEIEHKRILMNCIHYLECLEISGVEAQEMAECLNYLKTWNKMLKGKIPVSKKARKKKEQEVKIVEESQE